ncbi:MAG TPA: glycosyltransferase family 39 protein, partial [Vicinamibacterales bacterium]|nr:glycosyltransferase family 39 protein [Vicinamibacterales bacterium]
MTAKRLLIVTALLYSVLAAVMTYPQVLHLRDGVHDDGDPLLNTWALAWVAHELPIAPAHLFDANIFHPERRTLAFSETLLAPGLAAAPLRWAGLGPILIYNIVFLSGFIVSGMGTALLVRRLTGRADAGILAGLVFAFLPFRIDHYPHLQLQQTQCLPFALWAFHRLLENGRIRDGILFGVFTAGQILSCMYYGLFLVPYFAVVCGTLLVARWRDDSLKWRSTIAALIVAAILAAAVAAPVGRAYLRARSVVGERRTGEVMAGSA